jgi:hypothetical protein
MSIGYALVMGLQGNEKPPRKGRRLTMRGAGYLSAAIGGCLGLGTNALWCASHGKWVALVGSTVLWPAGTMHGWWVIFGF